MADLFDWEKSVSRKEHGIDAAAASKSVVLQQAREIAAELCRLYGETDADEVGKVMDERHGVETMGPAAGAIFRQGFEFTGRRKTSSRKKNHAREIKIWKLK
jgi:hypothetical protein